MTSSALDEGSVTSSALPPMGECQLSTKANCDDRTQAGTADLKTAVVCPGNSDMMYSRIFKTTNKKQNNKNFLLTATVFKC